MRETKRVLMTQQCKVEKAVAGVLFNTTLPWDPASCVPVSLLPLMIDNSISVFNPLLCWPACTVSDVPYNINASTIVARVQSVSGASNKLIDICFGFPIAAKSSVTPPQHSLPSICKQKCNLRCDARRLRRLRNRHRTPQHSVTQTVNVVSIRHSPFLSAFHSKVWTLLIAPMTPCSGFVI